MGHERLFESLYSKQSRYLKVEKKKRQNAVKSRQNIDLWDVCFINFHEHVHLKVTMYFQQMLTNPRLTEPWFVPSIFTSLKWQRAVHTFLKSAPTFWMQRLPASNFICGPKIFGLFWRIQHVFLIKNTYVLIKHSILETVILKPCSQIACFYIS